LATASALIEARNKNPLLLLSESACKEFAYTKKSTDSNGNNNKFDAVVVGLAPSMLNYKNLDEAFRVLIREDSSPLLIATHRGKTFRQPNGQLSLGPGPFVALLETAIYPKTCETIVVGKPSPAYFSAAMKAVQSTFGGANAATLEKHECLMIGDDLSDDVLGAMAFGMHGCLVQTGKVTESTEVSKAEFLVKDFSEFVEIFLGQQGRRHNKL